MKKNYSTLKIKIQLLDRENDVICTSSYDIIVKNESFGDRIVESFFD